MELVKSVEFASTAESAPNAQPTETVVTYQPLIVVPPIFPQRGPPNVPEIPQPMPLFQQLLPIIPIVGVVTVVIAGAIGGVVVGVIGAVLRALNRKKNNKKNRLYQPRFNNKTKYYRPKPSLAKQQNYGSISLNLPTPPTHRQVRHASSPQSNATPLFDLASLESWMQLVNKALGFDLDVAN